MQKKDTHNQIKKKTIFKITFFIFIFFYLFLVTVTAGIIRYLVLCAVKEKNNLVELLGEILGLILLIFFILVSKKLIEVYNEEVRKLG